MPVTTMPARGMAGRQPSRACRQLAGGERGDPGGADRVADRFGRRRHRLAPAVDEQFDVVVAEVDLEARRAIACASRLLRGAGCRRGSACARPSSDQAHPDPPGRLQGDRDSGPRWPPASPLAGAALALVVGRAWCRWCVALRVRCREEVGLEERLRHADEREHDHHARGERGDHVAARARGRAATGGLRRGRPERGVRWRTSHALARRRCDS